VVTREEERRPAGVGFSVIVAMAIVVYGMTFLTSSGRYGRGGSWLKVLALVGVMVLALVGWAGTVTMSYQAGSRVVAVVAMVSAAVGVVPLALAVRTTVVKAAGQGERFSYAMSVAPMRLAAALVLALMVGLPMRMVERRAVARIAANGGLYSLGGEVERSFYKDIKERIAR
jgi:hypothetical protein